MNASLERLELVAAQPVRRFVIALFGPMTGLVLSLVLLAAAVGFSLAHTLHAGPAILAALFAGTVLACLTAVGSLLVFLAQLPRWLPDLHLVLTRHHLEWGERRVLLETITAVSEEGLTVAVGDERLALPSSFRVDPDGLAGFRSALRQRVTTLRAAEVRPEDQAQLQGLASAAAQSRKSGSTT